MNKENLSRSSEVDTDKCVSLIGGNRFNMVLVAALRAREISQRNRESNKHEYLHSPITALLEIQEGKIGKEYLRKIK